MHRPTTQTCSSQFVRPLHRMPCRQLGFSIPNSWLLPPASPQMDRPAWPLHPHLQAVIELLARPIVVIHLPQCHTDIREAYNRLVQRPPPLEVALRQKPTTLPTLPRFFRITSSFA